MEVVLFGLRGSGKSTLARALSAVSGDVFVDLDDEVATMLGHPSAAAAWNASGEDRFRAVEVDALREVLRRGVPIIALGGGTPTAPGAESLLRRIKREAPPRLVYLRASAATLARRVAADGRTLRPSLTGRDPVEEIPDVLARRDPLYLDLADAVVEVDHITLDETLSALRSLLNR